MSQSPGATGAVPGDELLLLQIRGGFELLQGSPKGYPFRLVAGLLEKLLLEGAHQGFRSRRFAAAPSLAEEVAVVNQGEGQSGVVAAGLPATLNSGVHHYDGVVPG
jgi:hypothetical protein